MDEGVAGPRDRGERRRPVAVWVVAGVVVALVLAGGVWWASRPAGCPGATCDTTATPAGSVAGSSPSTTATATFGARDAARVAGAFNGHDPAAVREVLAGDLRADAEAIAAQAVPPGAAMSIDLVAATPIGSDLVRVPATLSGPEPVTVAMVLRREEGRWVVVGTSAPGEVVGP